jgi:hypothetical protein
MVERKPIGVRLDEKDLVWLARNGLPMTTQLRKDLEVLRSLRKLAQAYPGTAFGEALNLIEQLFENPLSPKEE